MSLCARNMFRSATDVTCDTKKLSEDVERKKRFFTTAELNGGGDRRRRPIIGRDFGAGIDLRPIGVVRFRYVGTSLRKWRRIHKRRSLANGVLETWSEFEGQRDGEGVTKELKLSRWRWEKTLFIRSQNKPRRNETIEVIAKDSEAATSL